MATLYYTDSSGTRWVSYWEPNVVPRLDSDVVRRIDENGRYWVLDQSGIDWIDYQGGAKSESGPSISPGDFPPTHGAFSPGPAWSPGPPRPGPTPPNFDPPVRPPERRTGLLFPLDICWILEGHEGQDEDIYARVNMDMGTARLRRMYTVVPHVRRAKIFLTFEESKVFHEWFEWTLGVGELRFIAQFHDAGYGIRWFEAEFVKPWEAEYIALGTPNEEGNAGRAWKISVEVRLYGEGQIHNPLLDPTATAKFRGAFKLPLVTQSSLDVVNFFTLRLSCPLTSSYSDVKMEAAFELPLEGRALPASSLTAEFFTYLSSSAKIGGWARFTASFTLGNAS